MYAITQPTGWKYIKVGWILFISDLFTSLDENMLPSYFSSSDAGGSPDRDV